jgi:hypothetical protein
LLGIAFVIATCIQLQGVLTKQWHRDYRYVDSVVGTSHLVKKANSQHSPWGKLHSNPSDAE